MNGSNTLASLSIDPHLHFDRFVPIGGLPSSARNTSECTACQPRMAPALALFEEIQPQFKKFACLLIETDIFPIKLQKLFLFLGRQLLDHGGALSPAIIPPGWNADIKALIQHFYTFGITFRKANEAQKFLIKATQDIAQAILHDRTDKELAETSFILPETDQVQVFRSHSAQRISQKCYRALHPEERDKAPDANGQVYA